MANFTCIVHNFASSTLSYYTSDKTLRYACSQESLVRFSVNCKVKTVFFRRDGISSFDFYSFAICIVGDVRYDMYLYFVASTVIDTENERVRRKDKETKVPFYLLSYGNIRRAFCHSYYEHSSQSGSKISPRSGH